MFSHVYALGELKILSICLDGYTYCIKFRKCFVMLASVKPASYESSAMCLPYRINTLKTGSIKEVRTIISLKEGVSTDATTAAANTCS